MNVSILYLRIISRHHPICKQILYEKKIEGGSLESVEPSKETICKSQQKHSKGSITSQSLLVTCIPYLVPLVKYQELKLTNSIVQNDASYPLLK